MKERLRTLQARIAAFRDTHLHQVTAALARRYETIAVEDLNLRNMTRSARGTVDEPGTNVAQKAGLNRSLLDAAPGKLIQMLTYKEEAGAKAPVESEPRRRPRPSRGRRRKDSRVKLPHAGIRIAKTRRAAEATLPKSSS